MTPAPGPPDAAPSYPEHQRGQPGGPQLVTRPLSTLVEFEACVALQRATWGESFSECVPVSLFDAAVRTGGVVAGAFDSRGHLVGFVFGLTGIREGRRVHWSDMLAVRPGQRDAGIGVALKRFQREAVRALGVTLVNWTFDPLESRNAYINLMRLGAVARQYLRDFYGESDSPLHQGIGTDRLLVDWELDSERVQQRLAAATGPSPAARWHTVPMIHTPRREGGLLLPGSPRLSLEHARLRLAIPANIQVLKAASPEAARHWRAVTRQALEAYLQEGYEVCELLREGEWSSYGLQRVLSGSGRV